MLQVARRATRRPRGMAPKSNRLAWARKNPFPPHATNHQRPETGRASMNTHATRAGGAVSVARSLVKSANGTIDERSRNND
jgi:hypothetical protein